MFGICPICGNSGNGNRFNQRGRIAVCFVDFSRYVYRNCYRWRRPVRIAIARTYTNIGSFLFGIRYPPTIHSSETKRFPAYSVVSWWDSLGGSNYQTREREVQQEGQPCRPFRETDDRKTRQPYSAQQKLLSIRPIRENAAGTQ